MGSSACVEQRGTVEQIAGHYIRVRVHREASCGDCKASGICFMGEGKERELEINNFTPGLKVGDHVEVIISRSLGNKAVFLGYMVPFIILLTSLLILNAFGANDLFSGIVSILAIMPYFLILYLLRNRLRKTFTLSARKK
jgi:positive regulator of sigma E activity